MKISYLLALLTVSFALTGCDSTSSSAKKTDGKPVAKTAPGTNPNLGTAGNPIRQSSNGEYSGVDPMSSGTDGRMYNKNY